MDKLREVTLKNVVAPANTHVIFRGAEVGYITSNNGKDSVATINSDILVQLVRSNKVLYSLEVIG